MLRYHLAPSDEGAVERSETEGEKKLRFYKSLPFSFCLHNLFVSRRLITVNGRAQRPSPTQAN